MTAPGISVESLKAGPIISVASIKRIVVAHYNLPRDAMRSRRVDRPVAQRRQIAMYFARKYTTLSTTKIGQLFGGRDHTTVVHGCRAVAIRLQRWPAYVEELTAIERILLARALEASLMREAALACEQAWAEFEGMSA